MRSLRLAIVVIVALCTNAVQAKLVVTPEHGDGVYKIDEDIRWHIDWTGDAPAPASAEYVIKRGGLTELRKGAISSFPAEVQATLDAPATLLLEVKTADERVLGGAVAAPDQIKPSAPRPDDFDAFWESKVKELAAVAPNEKLEPRDAGKPDIDYWHITFDNIHGSHINGQLARPKAAAGKLPALLIVQWAGVYPLERHWVIDRAGDGWLALNINAHDLPIDKTKDFYEQQNKGPLDNYPGIGNDDRETSYFLRMYLSCYRAAEYLAHRDDWDGKTLVVIGGSQGGMQSLVTAALHPKITAALASVPAGCDMLGPDIGRQGGWPMWYWNVGKKDSKKVREASRYFDVVNFVPRIKCPVLIGAGLIDETCPPAGILAAKNLITSPKELVLMPRAGHQNENDSHAPIERRFWGEWLPALVKGNPPPIAVSSKSQMRAEPYNWRSVEIVGGGFVSGIVTHPAQKGLMYARTDIGGAYRRDAANPDWIPLTDWVDQERWTYTGIESIAVDPADAQRVYLAVGSYTNRWSGPGAILRSSDQGRTWQITPLPFKNGANENGRGCGERLAVDPNHGATLLFGSRKNGLWRSDDAGVTWSQVQGFPDTADTRGIGIVFVHFDKSSGKPGAPTPVVYAGVSSHKTALYRSTDAGKTWEAVANQPTGFVPHHIAQDIERNTLYITYGNGPGPNDVTDGAAYKLDTKAGVWTDITPIKPAGRDVFGYAGVTVDPQRPGVVMVSTLDRWKQVDDLFRSSDGGATWAALRERSVRDVSIAPWLSFGKSTPVPIGHWISDIEIDPFDSNHLLYVTGWGMWESKDVAAADKNEPTHWTVAAKGINEVVTNEVVSPPAGDARTLSVMWDIDGFRHVDPDHSPAWGFFKPHYGRNTSIDFAETNPEFVVRVYGVQQMGGIEPTKTSGSYSLDNGVTWRAFASKPARVRGDGTIAVSADGATLVWTPIGDMTHVSRDRGGSWTRCEGLPPRMRVVSDRVNSGAFYAFDPTQGTFYGSTDGGATFAVKQTGQVAKEAYLRAVPGRAGSLWLATTKGLFNSTDAGENFRPIPGIASARRVGFGKPAPVADHPAVFITGTIGDTYGFYRSDDAGQTWLRINDDQHQFGEITSITGDPRQYGRVYLSSRNRGILYGDPAGK